MIGRIATALLGLFALVGIAATPVRTFPAEDYIVTMEAAA